MPCRGCRHADGANWAEGARAAVGLFLSGPAKSPTSFALS